MDPVTIRLAGVPVGKGRPRFGNGRAFTPAATKSYEAALRFAAQEAMGSRPPFACALEVRIVAAFPIPKSMSKANRRRAQTGDLVPAKRPDWDNLAKMTDALNEVVWKDDAQIVEGSVRKEYSDTPGLTIEVWPSLGRAE